MKAFKSKVQSDDDYKERGTVYKFPPFKKQAQY